MDAFAFFDVDGTLIRTKSMFSFERHYLRATGLRATRRLRVALFDAEVTLNARLLGRTRQFMNRAFYHRFRDRHPGEVASVARDWFQIQLERDRDLFIERTLAELRRHKASGRQVIFVSGSLGSILKPLQDLLGVDGCLATRLEIVDQRFTGRIDEPQMIGEGKAKAVQAFLSARGADPDASYAYGDDVTDLPMLEAVGHPVAVIGDTELRAHAQRRAWQILDLSDPSL